MEQTITKKFNTRLHTKAFTYKMFKIKLLQVKNRTVKAEKRKLAEFARYARE